MISDMYQKTMDHRIKTALGLVAMAAAAGGFLYLIW